MFLLQHNWDSLLYLLIVGGIIFLFSIIAPIIAGDISWKRREDRRTIKCMILGTLLYWGFLIAWQLYAIKG